MLYANDRNLNKVHIDETNSKEEYTCHHCGALLITKKGDIRVHHFAHSSGHLCTETWKSKREIGEWHNNWQEFYPRDNQEVYLNLGEVRHRADVIVGKTVVEFQHSILSKNEFDERNNFYSNLGYRVMWLFDVQELVEKTIIVEKSVVNQEILFTWKNPTKAKAFNAYDIKAGRTEIFFQMNNEENCIVKVKDVSWKGFEEFTTSNWMSKQEFLEYTGLKDGVCEEPIIDYSETNIHYEAFKEKYNIELNKQQERAVISLEGAVLLLAVPGSGKTTVLVDRIGYMVCEKHIKPENILVLTFSNAAVDEIKERCKIKFGIGKDDGLNIRTINSLCLEIYTHYRETQNKSAKQTIRDKDRKYILTKVFKKINNGKYPTQGELSEMETTFSYIKNMCMDIDDIQDGFSLDNLSELYSEYCNELNRNEKLDYDDQLIAAHWILTDPRTSQYFEYWNKKFKYICVDEAQDTSVLQHCIIRRLSAGNNIFMVGDEDQSIYGFRGAYPQALLNFRADYKNPFIMRMETNYRSTQQIVDAATTFINQNRGRYNKEMKSAIGDGDNVNIIDVKTREEQFDVLLSVAKECKEKTAFLYRDNESAIALVNLLLENEIPFMMNEAKMNFFNIKAVKDAMTFLRFIVNPNDLSSFKTIGYKCGLGLKQKDVNYIVESCKKSNSTLREKLTEENNKFRVNCETFFNDIDDLRNAEPEVALKAFRFETYEGYARWAKVNTLPIETLEIMARDKHSIPEFLDAMDKLEKAYSNMENHADSNVVLSTIHSSKGEEYNSVYVFDIFDGRFPDVKKNRIHRSKDNLNAEQEERRLFYVAITRAKKSLNLIRISGRKSSYIDELGYEIPLYKQYDCNNEVKQIEQRMEKIKTSAKDEYRSYSGRIITCIHCGKTADASEFCIYGGNYGMNGGICHDCDPDRKKNVILYDDEILSENE